MSADLGELATSVSIPGLRLRLADPARDAEAVAAVLEAANRNDGVEWLPTAEDVRHEWEHTVGLDPARDVLVAEVDGEPGLAAVVEGDWRLRAGRVFHQNHPVVRPVWRRRGLGRALLRWAEAHVAEGVAAGEMGDPAVPHLLAGWADLEIEGTPEFAVDAGYEIAGYGIMMTRDLTQPIPDLPLPEGIEVRPVRPEDHHRIWDADSEAFQDHRDPATRTEADFDRWFTIPSLDTSLWEVAWDGDEVVGSVMNFVFREENERAGWSRGWLEHISVRRPWRKRGIAAALVARSLRRLRDMGLTEGALGADAENLTGAVRLYESLGFRRARTSANYRKALPGLGGEGPRP
jgi:mycothiol synthase